VTSGNAAASVVADSVTLLSNTWNDVNSFAYPYDPAGGRPGNTTTYRAAIAAGKGLEFVQVAGTSQDYGTDGGVHNFLRYLESWSGTLYYKGSLVSFFYSQQAIGIFKCCTTVYGPPTRGYSFDSEFLTPALLPPRTPAPAAAARSPPTGWSRAPTTRVSPSISATTISSAAR